MFGQVTTYQSIRPRQRVGYCIARHQQSSEFRPGRNNDFESNGIVGVQQQSDSAASLIMLITQQQRKQMTLAP